MFSEIQNDLQKKLQLDQVSFIKLQTPLTIEFYKKWLNHNYYGSMTYLKEHLHFKETPQLINPQFQSVITITQSYFPTILATQVAIPARVALYAQNNDYHFWLKDKLNQAIFILKEIYPDEIFTPYVDSGPILEKDISYQAGHGWFGKNSCLIHPKKGSLFFIAEILTSLKVETSAMLTATLTPLPDMCGTCTKCIDICPTNAIIEPKVIKADQCISYLTIESKTNPPLALRPKMNDWFFGCDLCQTTCPWNEKFFRSEKIEKSNLISTNNLLNLSLDDRDKLISFFKMILTSSNKYLQKYFYGAALARAGGFGLKRNALIVIANRNITELRNEVQLLEKDLKLGELATWTSQQLKI